MFEFGRCESGRQASAVSQRDIAALFRNYYCNGVSGLGYAECRAVTQTERARNIAVMAYRQDAARRNYLVAVDDHRAVVERRVLEKYVFDQTGVDLCVYDVARLA